MSSRVRLILLFVGISFALPASAADKDNVVCGVNQERVWVYSSLLSFDVAMKLKCSETVEIIGRVKGYVKIRAQNGQEGYVPDSAIPNLPPLEDSNDKLVASNSSKQPLSSRSAVHAAAATSSPAATLPKPVATMPANVTPAASKPVAAEINSTATPPRPVVTMPANVNRTASAPAAPIPSTAPSDSEHSEANANATVGANATVSANARSSHPISTGNSASSAAKTSKTKTASTKKGTGAASAASTHPPVTSPDVVLSTNQSSTTSKAAPAIASSAKPASNYSSVSPAPAIATTRTASASADPDEDIDPPPFKTEDYSACHVYFSAYGLSANQYRWFMQNRKKSHPSVCPAPAPALVDFVIIFTHDVDFFSYTMPETFHTDKNGFSDFTPLVAINTPAMSQSDADKAHHEYVWVFHTTRGTFDPAKFSSRRHPLFTKNESNSFGSRAGDRTVEDALAFIEGHGATR